MATPELLLQVDAIQKTVTLRGVTKNITETYWTSDIVPVIYPLWDSDKDKLVLFSWYANDTYMAQKRKYTKNFKTDTFYWNDYEMEDVGGVEGKKVYDKFKEAFFLADSLEDIDYQTQFAKIHVKTAQTSWLSVRLARNFLLTETDWVFVEDSGISAEDKELYKKYRKKLRDLPNEANTTDPIGVKFPINPSYYKNIILQKDANAVYLETDDQFVPVASTYFNTFKEKITSYLIVSELTEGLYNKSFLDELSKAGVVYTKDDPNKADLADATWTGEEVEKTKTYLEDLLKKIEEEQSQ
tara:strand:- start:113 stop:1006 length:894 start_codon:yes stop_codon:yes gene_type:complete